MTGDQPGAKGCGMVQRGAKSMMTAGRSDGSSGQRLSECWRVGLKGAAGDCRISALKVATLFGYAAAGSSSGPSRPQIHRMHLSLIKHQR